MFHSFFPVHLAFLLIFRLLYSFERKTICVCVTSNYRLKSRKAMQGTYSYRDFCHFIYLLKHDAKLKGLSYLYVIGSTRSVAFFLKLFFLSLSVYSSSWLLSRAIASTHGFLRFFVVFAPAAATIPPH